MNVLKRLNPFFYIRLLVEDIRDLLVNIHGDTQRMVISADQVQANLDNFVKGFQLFSTNAIALLNKLATANANGNQLDPVKVQADIDQLIAIQAQTQTAFTADDPDSSTGSTVTTSTGSTTADPNSGAGTGVTPGVEGGAAVDPQTGLPLTGSVAMSNPKAVDDAQAAQNGETNADGKSFSST